MQKLKLAKEVFKETETEITRSIRRLLELKGIKPYPSHSGRFPPAHKGMTDILAIIPPGGRWLAIEVKRPGYEPTEAQVQFMEEIKAYGGIAFMATSIEDVERQLQLKDVADYAREKILTAFYRDKAK